MFYTNKVLFQHIPRTGGTWLTDFAVRMLGASADVHYLKHATVEQIHAAIPETRQLQAFSIGRDRDEISRSWYRHCCDYVAQAVDTPQWVAEAEAVRSLGYAEFWAGEWNVATRPYWTESVRLFPYEKPLREVVQWLLETEA